jgi:thiamine monophosphate synthase
VIAIGGIGIGNIRVLTDSGFRKVAVIRAVSASKDPLESVGKLKEAITQ